MFADTRDGVYISGEDPNLAGDKPNELYQQLKMTFGGKQHIGNQLHGGIQARLNYGTSTSCGDRQTHKHVQLQLYERATDQHDQTQASRVILWYQRADEVVLEITCLVEGPEALDVALRDASLRNLLLVLAACSCG